MTPMDSPAGCVLCSTDALLQQTTIAIVDSKLHWRQTPVMSWDSKTFQIIERSFIISSLYLLNLPVVGTLDPQPLLRYSLLASLQSDRYVIWRHLVALSSKRRKLSAEKIHIHTLVRAAPLPKIFSSCRIPLKF